MRLFILSFIFVLISSTFSLAVNTPVTTGDQAIALENIQDQGDQNGLTKRLTSWVKKSFETIKNIVKKSTSDDDSDLLMLILIFVFPPVAMYMYEGKEWTNRVTLNLILTLLCGLPGIIHAAVVIFGKK